jgi:hypothetical protein
MWEIRKSGSEGGGIETNRRFLPLSVRRVLSSFERQNSTHMAQEFRLKLC